jgi:8-oxo-dGTP pyrophosphatase MutT (NUDIX family)
MNELPTDFGDPAASAPREATAREATAREATAREALAAEADLFTPASVFARIAERLPRALPPEALDRAALPLHGDHHLNAWTIAPDVLAGARVAAVLIGLVERDGVLHVLLTQRASALRVHSGQIAFPGGKMDPEDASPAATAIREAWEEIGIAPERIEVLGYLGAYLSGSGFRIVPVVARLHEPLAMTLNPDEVVETFEVPFSFVMSEANHQLREREWKGGPRKFYAVPYGERNIWGITAGILRVLYERLYRP